MQACRAQLENELAGLQQARAELHGKYAREQQVAQESGKRIAELEKQLGQSAAEWKQQVENLRTQLDTTTAANKQADSARDAQHIPWPPSSAPCDKVTSAQRMDRYCCGGCRR